MNAAGMRAMTILSCSSSDVQSDFDSLVFYPEERSGYSHAAALSH